MGRVNYPVRALQAPCAKNWALNLQHTCGAASRFAQQASGGMRGEGRIPPSAWQPTKEAAERTARIVWRAPNWQVTLPLPLIHFFGAEKVRPRSLPALPCTTGLHGVSAMHPSTSATGMDSTAGHLGGSWQAPAAGLHTSSAVVNCRCKFRWAALQQLARLPQHQGPTHGQQRSLTLADHVDLGSSGMMDWALHPQLPSLSLHQQFSSRLATWTRQPNRTPDSSSAVMAEAQLSPCPMQVACSVLMT